MPASTQNFKHNKWSQVCKLLVISASLVAATANAKVLKLDGQNDSSVDRAAIQSAIDSAPEKSVIQLRGTFQFDGDNVIVDRSDLTIMGAGPGATLLGLVDNNGLPQGGFDHNNGITIEPSGPETVANIQIKNLEFSGFALAVQLNGAGPGLARIDVKNLRMTNNGFSVFSEGTVDDLTIHGNLITSAAWGGIFFAGGPVSNVRLSDNVVLSADVSALPFALEIDGPSTNMLVSGNTFQGGSYAVGLFGEAHDVVLTEN